MRILVECMLENPDAVAALMQQKTLIASAAL
jgi:hypothetical protein